MELSHQSLSDYTHFLFEKKIELNRKRIIASEMKKKWNSGNYIYDYTNSFFGKDF